MCIESKLAERLHALRTKQGLTQEETAAYVDAVNALVGYRLASTEMILDTDFYAQVLGEVPRVTGRLGDDVPEPSGP